MKNTALGAMAWWAILTATGVTLPINAAAQRMIGIQNRDVHIRIEAARSTVRLGEPIMVRLTLVNQSSSVLMVHSGAPHTIVPLLVYDEEGNQVRQTVDGGDPFFRGKGHDIPPGGELKLLSSGKEWGDLRDWGFDLKSLGNYRISAKPLASDVSASRESGEGTSDVVEVTIQR